MQSLNPMEPSALPEPVVLPIQHLSAPLRDLAAWTRYFREAEIPVLEATAKALEDLRAIEDDVDASMLNAATEADPLMTLKVLAHVASRRRPGFSTETETVTSSIVMMGITPFFTHFGAQTTLQNQLRDQPLALQGLSELLRRAERAGNFALGFAVHRGDTDAGVIHQAAFLHDFAEMLMWCHAPTLQLKIQEAQKADATLRTTTIQRNVLNIELDDLRQALMKLWRLPELLVRISDGKHADHPTVRNVVLAVRLARHTMQGWENAAIPDDIEDIAKLLNASPRVALAFVRKIDRSA